MNYVSFESQSVSLTLVNGRLRVTAELPIYARSEPNSRGHWARRHVRTAEQRGAASLVLTLAKTWLREAVAAGQTLAVVLTRVRPEHRQALDGDNLQGSLKAVRDGVADAIGLPDNDKRLDFQYAQVTAADYAVRIEINSQAPKGRKGKR